MMAPDPVKRAVRLANKGLALEERYQRTEALRHLNAAIKVLREAAHIAADFTGRPTTLAALATTLRIRFERLADPADLEAAVTYGQQALDTTPADYPDRAAVMTSLGLARRLRFQAGGPQDDMEAAVQLARSAVDAVPVNAPERGSLLSNLGVALRVRFVATGAPEDLEAAVQAGRSSVESVAPEHPNRAGYEYNLAHALRLKVRDSSEPPAEDLADYADGRWRRYAVTGESADLDAAIDAGRRVVAVATSDDPNRELYLSNLSLAVWTRFEATGAPEHLDAVVDVGRQAVDNGAADAADLAGALLYLSRGLGLRFELTGVPADGDAAVATMRQAIDIGSGGQPADLGVSVELWSQLHRARGLGELDAVIGALEQALGVASTSDRPKLLDLLAEALWMRFDHTGAPTDLVTAIRGNEPADSASDADPRPRDAAATPRALQKRIEDAEAPTDLDVVINAIREGIYAFEEGDPNRITLVLALATATGTRFERTGELADLNATIDAAWQGAEAVPDDDPVRGWYVLALVGSLQTRFKLTGAQADADAADHFLRQALHAQEAGSPLRAQLLAGLAATADARYERSKAITELDTAILAWQQVINATPADDPGLGAGLSNLGRLKHARFRRTGDTVDVDGAVQAWREASETGHPARGVFLSSLCLALGERYERTGVETDLAAAIDCGQQALDLLPTDDPERGGALMGLGGALRGRYRRTGELADLDASIDAVRQAADAAAAEDPERATRLASLAGILRARYNHTGALADLEAAIGTGRQAVAAAPAGHPDRAMCLANLAAALQSRFDRTGALADLDASIDAGQQAIGAHPTDYRELVGMESNLSISLRARYQLTSTLADLDAAADLMQHAVDAIATDHPNRAAYLSNLGVIFRDRHDHTGAPEDLDAAVEAGRQAANSVPADHPDRALYLRALGGSLMARGKRSNTPSDFHAAADALAAAANVTAARPTTRIDAAREAAEILWAPQPGRAADLMESAVRLLAEVAPRQLHRSDQQYALGGFAGLANDAAALALSAPGSDGDRAARALQLLESGRAIILSQALETRSDLTELEQRHPDLAARFVDLRDQLDSGAADPGHSTLVSPDQRSVTDRYRLASELKTTVEDIRARDGFGSFLLPPAPEELIAEAYDGPIVVFNTSRHRCDALLLTPQGITHLPLPELEADQLAETIKTFYSALAVTQDPAASGLVRIEAQGILQHVLEWVWDVAAEPVLHALGFDEPHTADAAWPRVWWVPGGLLGLLPLHAAGYHRRTTHEPGNRAVMDRVVSSYTPTVKALRHTRKATRRPRAARRALIVAMPTTPEASPLPYASDEAAMLCAELPGVRTLIGDVTDPDLIDQATVDQTPTRDNVLASLPECSIAHFACHATSDPTDPSLSRLLLRDHITAPLTVASLASVNLDQAELAYLSACGTSFNLHWDLLDEAIHLASAFQLAGFRHVVGTLWAIQDRLAVSAARTFYSALRSLSGTFTPEASAYALHHAVHTLRGELRSTPSLWASYVHVGA
ncbi:CHAT domain-containing protein [Streptomyces mirabilis]|uniref:CHAT domain-containing protein n=1 Tax=Streptomyces mirabilis TaxID=68239 RepID=UPI0036687F3B